MTHFEHRVRERAYYIWEAEGRVFGKAEEHWLRAETECRAPLSPSSSARAEPVLVQATAPALTLSPSPAAVLGETLKAKPSRSRGVVAKVEAKGKAVAEASAVTAPKTPKKAATAKAAAPKAATPKVSEAKAGKASKPTARARAAEPAAMVH